MHRRTDSSPARPLSRVQLSHGLHLPHNLLVLHLFELDHSECPRIRHHRANGTELAVHLHAVSKCLQHESLVCGLVRTARRLSILDMDRTQQVLIAAHQLLLDIGWLQQIH